jgi:tetratricopeptide (TPR) repeat protein
MPFGEKKDPSGIKIDFDSIYDELIYPAIEQSGLEPIRADEERTGGIIHKAMFERLILCDFAVADLTTANANVFYQLGVRHAVHPYKTALIFAEKTQLPFDVNLLRAMPYKLDDSGKLSNKNKDFEALVRKLDQLKQEVYTDSPLFQIFDELKPQTVSHQKTDIFREQVAYSQKIKERLKEARKQGQEAVKKLEIELGDIKNIESGIIIDLFLSYRATKAWKEMIALVEKMPKPLAERTMIQEQLGFALNRDGQKEKAEEVLLQVIDKYAPSSENYGLLGRIYKDKWENAKEQGDELIAQKYLEKAIEAYMKGFEADWRDAYPGINAVTLLDLYDPEDPRKKELLPVVTYAVKQKVAKGKPDYWDYATLLELAVLAEDQSEAEKYLGKSLIFIREPWEPETTARNLGLIREARESRGLNTQWIEEIENHLLEKKP